MDRRDFQRSLASAFGMLTLGHLSASSEQFGVPRVNGPRLLESLRLIQSFGANAEGGVSRLAYSDADLDCRGFVMELMRRAELEVSIDLAGNILGRRAGAEPGLAPLMFGSHIDSVPGGGNYDGQVGSMAAVEVAQTLADHALNTRHPLEVVIFQNEEGGKTGSRLLSGEFAERELDLVTGSGKTIREGIELLGGDPGRWREARRRPGDAAAYLELHVEQGGVLDRENIAIGIVEGIVGIKRWNVTVEGFANHAGTTPMDRRRDALLASAKFIEAVHDVVRRSPGTAVGTVGQVVASPGAPNVIPGRVRMSLELRDLSMSRIDELFERLAAIGTTIGTETGTAFRFDQFYVSGAAPTDRRLRALIAKVAADLQLSSRHMPSGAGHDAQSIARFAPVGMVFVPSVNGISHSPREFTRPEHIVAGADVLVATLLTADREHWA